MNTTPYLLHALSPLHAGTGQAAGLIDLPIARARATGIPFVPGSSIKGVLRDGRRGSEHEGALFGPRRDGPEGDHAAAVDHAGALIVGDARLLALPVRSFRGTFAFATSPLLLRLARRDLDAGGVKVPEPVEDLKTGQARVSSMAECRLLHERKIYLEDLDLDAAEHRAVGAWAEAIAGALPGPERALFLGRFAVVDDETMTFLWETAMQIDTRVRLNRNTGTVADGALWTEESLPPETLLLGLLSAQRSTNPRGARLHEAEVLQHALPAPAILQFGGKATVGRGRCRICPWPAGGK